MLIGYFEGIDSERGIAWRLADSLAKKVGGTDGFPSAPLEITAPGEESGTYDAFIDLSGIEDIALEQGVPEDEAAALRTDYQASPDDNVIISDTDHHRIVKWLAADQNGGSDRRRKAP